MIEETRTRPRSSVAAAPTGKANSERVVEDGSAGDAATAEPANEGLSVIGSATRIVIGSTTVLTAVLYYFGYVRTAALGREFGVSSEVFGFGASDYVLRAVSPMFPPLVAAAGGALAAQWLHQRVQRKLPASQRRIGARLERIGAILLVLATVGLFEFAADLTGLLFTGDGLLRPAVVVPLLAVAGALAYGYGVWLGTRYAERPATSGRTQLGAATWLGLAAYLLLGVFAFTFLYANAVGEGLATRVQAELARGEAPVVSIMSTSRLSFRADSVTELLLPAGTPDAPGGYRYRYDNLRLVLESAEHLFLLPLDWAPEPGRAWLHIVPIADGMRIDIDAGPSLTEASG